MNSSALIKLFGPRITVLFGDPTVRDRWCWAANRLPKTRNNERLLDAGCGTGAFSLMASKRGYRSLGFSFDERNQRVAVERADLCGLPEAKFEIQDLRSINERTDLIREFDVVVCFEAIEHILDDRSVVKGLAKCLKPGGRLLLSAPYYRYRAITDGENGPFQLREEGWHVRRGYSEQMFRELCDEAGLRVEEIDYCSGFLSQKLAGLMILLSPISYKFAWLSTFALRWIPPLFDPLISKCTQWPMYSICLNAYKPRFAELQ